MPTKRVLACLALAAGIGVPRLVSAATPAQVGPPSLQTAMLTIINHDRQTAGVGPLRAGRKLERVAVAHSLDMATHGYFSHVTPAGASPYDRIGRAGIRYHSAGENLGVDNDGHTSAAMLGEIEAAMLHSPEHRANLLRAGFTRVGIGIAIVGGQLYLTEDFKG